MEGYKLPLKVIERLKEKGYFKLTDKERVESNKRCFGSLLKSSKGDPQAEVEALRDWRGGSR